MRSTCKSQAHSHCSLNTFVLTFLGWVYPTTQGGRKSYSFSPSEVICEFCGLSSSENLGGEGCQQPSWAPPCSPHHALGGTCSVSCMAVLGCPSLGRDSKHGMQCLSFICVPPTLVQDPDPLWACNSPASHFCMPSG